MSPERSIYPRRVRFQGIVQNCTFYFFFRKIMFWHFQMIENSICYRTVPSRASGMPCGSSYGCFCVSGEESRRIVIWRAQTIENWICCRTVPSRASGMPCGSSYGRFCILWETLVEWMPGVTPWSCHVLDTPPLSYGVQLWGHLFGSNRPLPIPGVLYLLGLDCRIRGLFSIKFYSILLGVTILGWPFCEMSPPSSIFSHCHKTRGGR